RFPVADLSSRGDGTAIYPPCPFSGPTMPILHTGAIRLEAALHGSTTMSTNAASGAPAAANKRVAEARAMMALAWPMILTNLGQTAMTTTDVMMIGRLGPDALAAGTLGTSLYFAPMIFGLGLISATSPMIASELGRRS